MHHVIDLQKKLQQDNEIVPFKRLYGSRTDILKKQKARYNNLLSKFISGFGNYNEVSLFSSPGRTEIGGNHTDHNAGRVLAATVDLDLIAIVAKNKSNKIVIESEGYPRCEINIDELQPIENEKYTSQALVRGVCARMKELGYLTGGFVGYMTSNVPDGSGLSSSAAFEMLVVTILNHFYNKQEIDSITCAQISQYAENKYFGKPCGLMDQTTCAVGGFVTIDFMDFKKPVLKKVNFDFSSSGYSLVIVNTGGSHSDLNEDYAAIESEMKDVARAFGGEVLRQFDKKKLLNSIAELRSRLSDRAILRAIHFYDDDLRVVEQVNTLERNDFQDFLRLVVESGYSSWMLCQNCYTHKTIQEQPISIALAVSETILKGRGAWRVHGGGFAGTIQTFVPNDLIESYISEMRCIFGVDSCHEVNIRPDGAIKIHFD